VSDPKDIPVLQSLASTVFRNEPLRDAFIQLFQDFTQYPENFVLRQAILTCALTFNVWAYPDVRDREQNKIKHEALATGALGRKLAKIDVGNDIEEADLLAMVLLALASAHGLEIRTTIIHLEGIDKAMRILHERTYTHVSSSSSVAKQSGPRMALVHFFRDCLLEKGPIFGERARWQEDWHTPEILELHLQYRSIAGAYTYRNRRDHRQHIPSWLLCNETIWSHYNLLLRAFQWMVSRTSISQRRSNSALSSKLLRALWDTKEDLRNPDIVSEIDRLRSSVLAPDPPQLSPGFTFKTPARFWSIVYDTCILLVDLMIEQNIEKSLEQEDPARLGESICDRVPDEWLNVDLDIIRNHTMDSETASNFENIQLLGHRVNGKIAVNIAARFGMALVALMRSGINESEMRPGTTSKNENAANARHC
jgi:hypothetical protein